MKHLVTLALMLNLGVASVYANQKPVKMTFSGTSATSATDLQQPDTNNDEDNFAGDGTLGRFTLVQIRAVTKNPDPSGTCPSPTQTHFSEPAGAGVFRFHDGSLLNVLLTKGDDCIDFVALKAHCSITFQIAGGTGRFKNATGRLTFTETVRPVLAKIPVFFFARGEFTGTIFGVAEEEERPDDQQ
jgi:hypothetical protein